jgi:hypothetical protein
MEMFTRKEVQWMAMTKLSKTNPIFLKTCIRVRLYYIYIYTHTHNSKSPTLHLLINNLQKPAT